MKKTDTDMETVKEAATVPEAATNEPVTAGGPANAVASLSPEQLEELKQRAAKADEHWDRLLRTTADLDNYRKRAVRDHERGHYLVKIGAKDYDRFLFRT